MKVAELLSDNSPILIIKNEKQERQCELNERQLRGEFSNLKEVLATNLATNRGLAEIKKNHKTLHQQSSTRWYTPTKTLGESPSSHRKSFPQFH